MHISIKPTSKKSNVSVSAGRSRHEVVTSKQDRAKLKAEYDKAMAKIVPSAVKAGTTKKWAEDYVSDWYEQVVEEVQYGGGTIPNAIKAIRGLTVKDCVADFKLSLETAKKVKEKTETATSVKQAIIRKLGLTAAEFKVFCEIVRNEK